MKIVKLLIICILGLAQNVNGQKIISFGLNAGTGFNWLNNSNDKNFEGFRIKNSIKPNFGLTAQYYLNKKTSVLTGIQIIGYAFNYQAENYEVRFATTDSENIPYERIVNGIDIKESTSLITLQVPLCISHEIALSRDFRIFLSAGPSLAIPVSSQIKSSGTFSYKGFYSDGNFTLENIPLYGFNNNVEIQKNDKLNTNFLNLLGLVSSGFIYNINRYWRFCVDLNYSRSITSVVKQQGGKYYLSNEVGSFNSILGGRSVGLNNFSIGLSIRKNILM